MIELKEYQKQVIQELEDYLVEVKKNDASVAFYKITNTVYNKKEIEAPSVCIKVPTGGGKTILACNSIHTIYDNYLTDRFEKGLVIWLVPTDEIRTQTINALKDDSHPYRKVLNNYFTNNLLVMGFKEALSIKKSDIQDNLCIVVASFAAFRIGNKDSRKAYADNGRLSEHFDSDEQTHSLVEVIKKNKPLVIIDESHNAQTTLSEEMLISLNPIFVLEFTATPREKSNVLVNITAQQLQEEDMVKIPIWLENVTQWQATVREGIDRRNYLEKVAEKEKGEYIRPIALIQAEQEKPHEKKIYVDKIKEYLINEQDIPEEQIAIRTGERNEIKGIDLFSSKCEIRYIITVSALKEGWDNAFAYVLISVANLESRISIEQILGRILRLPKQKRKKQEDLNCSYVFTPSRSFSEAAKALEKGLVSQGYSAKYIRHLTNETEITPENIYKKTIEDDEIAIPCIAVSHKDKYRRLNYHTDLLGEDFKLQDQMLPIVREMYHDQNKTQMYDIEEGDKFKHSVQKTLDIPYEKKDFDEMRLLNWLDKKIIRTEYTQEDKRQYLTKILRRALDEEKIPLGDLSKNFYKLRVVINSAINNIEFDISEKKFKELEENKKLFSDKIFYTINNDTIQINNICEEKFNRHLFERAGNMNGEELDVALRIDALENIKWWYRNIEKKDFYIQGWAKNKFYPDFIIKTISGKYVIVEYKGEDRVSNDDTKYKNALGQKYQEITENVTFCLIEKSTTEEFIKTLKDM